MSANRKILSKGFEELIGFEEFILSEKNDTAESSISQSRNVSKKKKKKRKSKSILVLSEKLKLKKNKEKPVLPKYDESLKFLNKMKSWSSFGINHKILYALYQKKYFEPTKIQAKCLPPAICGRLDILGAAETGSGKTLAFGIPIINGIMFLKEQACDLESEENNLENDDVDLENSSYKIGYADIENSVENKEKNKLHALILTPTRELAVQVKNHLMDICKFVGINIALIVGGLAHEKQERILNKQPEIVVATPGRLWELINDGNEHLKNIQNIRYLAIDETDRMLERGHFAELSSLLERINLNENKKQRRQNFVFSATLTLVHDPPSRLKGKKRKRITSGQKLQDLINKIGLTNPKVIDITNAQVTAKNLTEYKIVCQFEEKDYYLFMFLRTHKGRTIIFCNSIGCVKRLANILTIINLKPYPLHANMEQRQRLKNLEKFQANNDGLLLATDLAARGLDIPNVNHVIHYQVPKTAEIYVHRSGRTARINAHGNALLLIEPQEIRTYKKLLHTLGKEKDLADFEVNYDTFKYIKKIIHIARDIDQLSLSIKKENSKATWYQKAIKEMDIILDEEELPKIRSSEADARIKKDLNSKKSELKSLLSQLTLSKLSKDYPQQFLNPNLSTNSPKRAIKRNKLKISPSFVYKNFN